MFLKKTLPDWFLFVKIAAKNHVERFQMSGRYLEAESKIVLKTSIDENPNANFDLGKTWCRIKYCPEDWLGSLQDTDIQTLTHTCPYFSDCCKCEKSNCAVNPMNHAYFDAREAYEVSKKNHINSVRRVFGIKTKE